MKCPFCGNEETQVKDSRFYQNGNSIKRRRYCTNCDNRFTTLEQIIRKEIIVLKKNGNKEIFDKFKLKHSIKLACGKRISEITTDKVLTNIINKFESFSENEIQSVKIGSMVMDELEKIDKVSFIRFASVYMNFEKPEDFNNFINKIKNTYDE